MGDVGQATIWLQTQTTPDELWANETLIGKLYHFFHKRVKSYTTFLYNYVLYFGVNFC